MDSAEDAQSMDSIEDLPGTIDLTSLKEALEESLSSSSVSKARGKQFTGETKEAATTKAKVSARKRRLHKEEEDDKDFDEEVGVIYIGQKKSAPSGGISETGKLAAAKAEEEKWGARSGNYKGKYPPGETDIQVSTPISYEEQRVRQLLQQISMKAFEEIKAESVSNYEVQTLWVNNQLVISANEPEAINTLVTKFKGGLGQLLEKEVAATVDPSWEEKIRERKMRKVRDVAMGGERARRLLEGEGEGTEVGLDLKEMIEVLQKEVEKKPPWVLCTVDKAAERIRNHDNDYTACLVEPENSRHAEQTLAIALYRSGIGSPSSIYGTKRPCTLCYLTLTYLTDVLGYTVDFNRNPGGLWVVKPGMGFDELVRAAAAELEENDEGLPKLTADEVEKLKDFIDGNFPTEVFITRKTFKKGDRKGVHYTSINSQEMQIGTPSNSSYSSGSESEEEVEGREDSS